MSTTVFLVRHGRTALNAARRFRGRLDVDLDKVGISEAERVAETLAPERPIAVYSSPLARALQTAAPLARRLGIAVESEPGLLDLDFGSWEGLGEDEAGRKDPEAFDLYRSDPLASCPPGGERLDEACARVLATLRDLVRRHPGSAIAAVSHELPIRLVLNELAGSHATSFWEIDPPTGSITILVGEEDVLRVLQVPGRPFAGSHERTESSRGTS